MSLTYTPFRDLEQIMDSRGQTSSHETTPRYDSRALPRQRGLSRRAVKTYRLAYETHSKRDVHWHVEVLLEGKRRPIRTTMMVTYDPKQDTLHCEQHQGNYVLQIEDLGKRTITNLSRKALHYTQSTKRTKFRKRDPQRSMPFIPIKQA